MSFARIKSSTYQSARNAVIQLLIDVYRKYRDVIGEENFTALDEEYFGYITPDMSDEVAALALNEYMNDVTEAVFSSFDVGRKPSGKSQTERFYHGFVLGLIVELQKTHKVTSNGERGFGRYDIMIKPLDVTAGKSAFIIEFKVKNERKGEKSLEDTAAAALAQIEVRKYEAAL